MQWAGACTVTKPMSDLHQKGSRQEHDARRLQVLCLFSPKTRDRIEFNACMLHLDSKAVPVCGSRNARPYFPRAAIDSPKSDTPTHRPPAIHIFGDASFLIHTATNHGKHMRHIELHWKAQHVRQSWHTVTPTTTHFHKICRMHLICSARMYSGIPGTRCAPAAWNTAVSPLGGACQTAKRKSGSHDSFATS